MNRVSPATLNSIKALCLDDKTTIVIFSGSAKVGLPSNKIASANAVHEISICLQNLPVETGIARLKIDCMKSCPHFIPAGMLIYTEQSPMTVICSRMPSRVDICRTLMKDILPLNYIGERSCLRLPCLVFVVQDSLLGQFGGLNCWLAAENGIFMRPPPTATEKKPVSFNPSSLYGEVLLPLHPVAHASYTETPDACPLEVGSMSNNNLKVG